jgi:hypothetical protein
MGRFWNRDHAELERRLRSARPEPREDFLDDLVSRVDASPSERPAATRVRGGAPRFALAGLVTAAMVVALAAFGGVGYAKSATEHVAAATSDSFTSVFSSGKSEHKDDKKDENHQASHHVYPQPGFWCATKGSKVRVKLIIFQERYDRLIARGYVVGPGPFSSRSAAKQACPGAPDGHEDDDD